MPARVVLVHDEPEFADELATSLRSAGLEVTIFADPLAAWSALEAAQKIELLITRVQFSPGRSNGIALARMAHAKRRSIRVLLLAQQDVADEVDERDTIMTRPVAVPDVVRTAQRLLAASEGNSG